MKIHCSFNKLVPIDKLKAHPKNANKHPKDQIERLAKILNYQGWRYPIKVSNLSGYVTSGHGRIEAAKLNEWKEIPVNFQDYDDEEQELADIHSDNAIASWSALDLSFINNQLENFGPDFDIDLLGLRNFVLEPAEKFDADKEWEELSEFEPADPFFRVIVLCENEFMGEQFLKNHHLKASKKNGKSCSVHWPEKAQDTPST